MLKTVILYLVNIRQHTDSEEDRSHSSLCQLNAHTVVLERIFSFHLLLDRCSTVVVAAVRQAMTHVSRDAVPLDCVGGFLSRRAVADRHRLAYDLLAFTGC